MNGVQEKLIFMYVALRFQLFLAAGICGCCVPDIFKFISRSIQERIRNIQSKRGIKASFSEPAVSISSVCNVAADSSRTSNAYLIWE